MPRLWLLLLLPLLLFGCGVTDPPDTALLVRSQLEDLSLYFNYKDSASLEALVLEEYSHNGMGLWQFRQLWQARMAQYALLEIENIAVTFSGDYAIVNMQMNFIDPGGNYSYLEPETSGDISYFHYTGNKWKICGRDYYETKMRKEGL